VRIDVLTLFPEALAPFFPPVSSAGSDAGCVSIRCTNIRDFALDQRETVDDRPFGGGPGMVMMCQTLFDAVEKLEAEDPCRHADSADPQGNPEPGRLPRVDRVAAFVDHLRHYEGIDERIGWFEAPGNLHRRFRVVRRRGGGHVLIDAVVRLLPGALGDEESCNDESFSHGLLEYPQYTRRGCFAAWKCPRCCSPGSCRIEQWRRQQAIDRTAQRPAGPARKMETRFWHAIHLEE